MMGCSLLRCNRTGPGASRTHPLHPHNSLPVGWVRALALQLKADKGHVLPGTRDFVKTRTPDQSSSKHKTNHR